MHPSGVAESSTSFGWSKGGNVTSAGWQVTLCDPMWHVSSRSGVATVRTAIYLLLTYLPPLGHNPQTPFADHMDAPLVGETCPPNLPTVASFNCKLAVDDEIDNDRCLWVGFAAGCRRVRSRYRSIAGAEQQTRHSVKSHSRQSQKQPRTRMGD